MMWVGARGWSSHCLPDVPDVSLSYVRRPLARPHTHTTQHELRQGQSGCPDCPRATLGQGTRTGQDRPTLPEGCHSCDRSLSLSLPWSQTQQPAKQNQSSHSKAANLETWHLHIPLASAAGSGTGGSKPSTSKAKAKAKPAAQLELALEHRHRQPRPTNHRTTTSASVVENLQDGNGNVNSAHHQGPRSKRPRNPPPCYIRSTPY